jgi:nicotinamide-nucleotide amidase
MYSSLRSMSYDLEILTIGDEILNGTIADTNAQWLCDQFRGINAPVRWKQTVSDHVDDICDALTLATGRADMVIVGGGLGGTSDDRSTEAAGAVLGEPLVHRSDELALVEEKRARFGLPLHPTDDKIVTLPESAQSLSNRTGLAPGFQILLNNVPVFFLPGVPREWRTMSKEHLLPFVQKHTDVRTIERTWKFFGYTESELATLAQPLSRPSVTLHFRAHFPEIHLRATANDVTTLDAFEETLLSQTRSRYFGDAHASFPGAVNHALRTRGWTVATAESCTGGMVSQLLTSEPGASDVFVYGAVTYANSAKQEVLQIDEHLLLTHGAVSEPVVRAMASHVRTQAKSTLGVAVSGVAGPSGGTHDKPVGTVHMALCTPDTLIHRCHQFPGNREWIRTLAAYTALDMVRKACAESQPQKDG